MRAKAGLKQRMVVTSVNSKQLAVAIISYCESVKSSKASNSEKDFALVQLNESVQTWKNKMVEQVEKASFCHQGLVQRASARIMGSKLPGGLAAQSNLDEFKRLIEEKERVAQICKQIRKLADPDVELALKARMRGGLKEELEVETWQRLRQFCRQDCLALCCFCVCFDLDVCSPPTSLCAVLVFRFAPASASARPAATYHLSLITTPHTTCHSHLVTQHSSLHHLSHLTHHATTHHSSTSHTSLTTPQLITAPLTAPLITSHSSHHNSSQLHLIRSFCTSALTHSSPGWSTV